MSGVAARTQDGEIFYIAQELRDTLRGAEEASGGVVATTEDGETFHISPEVRDTLRVTELDLIHVVQGTPPEREAFDPQASPLGSIDVTRLDQQWKRFDPLRRGDEKCSGTEDSGAMGCPG